MNVLSGNLDCRLDIGAGFGGARQLKPAVREWFRPKFSGVPTKKELTRLERSRGSARQGL